MVRILWKRGNDPDNFSIPYVTALGDLLGTGLLASAFVIISYVGDSSVDVSCILLYDAMLVNPCGSSHQNPINSILVVLCDVNSMTGE